jgi:Tfp pilus assembly protein PilE
MPKNLKSGFTLVEITMIAQLPVIAILAPKGLR